MKSIQERITKYLDYKGITPYKFCKSLSISMGYLDKRGAIGTDKYLKIIEYYPEINPEWLLTGNGEMLKDQEQREVVPKEEKPPDSKYIALLEKSNAMQEKEIARLEQTVQVLQKENADLKKAKEPAYNSQPVPKQVPELEKKT